MTNYFLDTSAFIEFFDGSIKGRRVLDHIRQADACTSMLVIAELADIFLRKEKKVQQYIDFIKKNIRIVSLDEKSCLLAAKIKQEHMKKSPRFGLIDALHYSCADTNNCVFLTTDKDFIGLTHAQVL